MNHSWVIYKYLLIRYVIKTLHPSSLWGNFYSFSPRFFESLKDSGFIIIRPLDLNLSLDKPGFRTHKKRFGFPFFFFRWKRRSFPTPLSEPDGGGRRRGDRDPWQEVPEESPKTPQVSLSVVKGNLGDRERGYGRLGVSERRWTDHRSRDLIRWDGHRVRKSKLWTASLDYLSGDTWLIIYGGEKNPLYEYKLFRDKGPLVFRHVLPTSSITLKVHRPTPPPSFLS